MSDYDKNGELHHNSEDSLNPQIEAFVSHLHERADVDTTGVTQDGDPIETLIFTQAELDEIRAGGRADGATPINVGILIQTMEANLGASLPQDATEITVQQGVDQMFSKGLARRLLETIRKRSGKNYDTQLAIEKKEVLKVLKILDERMHACEEWLELLGAKNPKLRRMLSGTAFFPMAATGLLRDFDKLWKNFWTIRLRRGLTIPETPPDERLLNQASSHAFRCEHSDEDIDYLKQYKFRRQLAIEYYVQIAQFFEDPKNKHCESLIAVFNKDGRYFRVQLPRTKWYASTDKENAILEIEGVLRSLENDQQEDGRETSTDVSVQMQDWLKTSAYGKHKDVKKNALFNQIFGHKENESTMVFLPAVREESRQSLTETVRSNRFFTGEQVTRVVQPLARLDSQTRQRVIVSDDFGITHRDLDGVESHEKVKAATSGLQQRLGRIDGQATLGTLQIETVVNPRLADEVPSALIEPEKFGETKIPLEDYRRIRQKLDELRSLYEVPKHVKEKLQCAGSFTLPDIIELALHSMGMEAGQMVVMQKNASDSLLDVAFSIANDALIVNGARLRQRRQNNQPITAEDRQAYAQALLGTSSRFIREKAWAMLGMGTASFFATLAGQKRLLEQVSKDLGGVIVGKRFVRGVNQQQFMVSVPSNTARLAEKRSHESRITSFYSAQTDSLAMDADSQIDGVGAVGVVDSPEEGLVLSIRSMPDQSWVTIQDTIKSTFGSDTSIQNIVIAAYRDLIFNNKPESLQRLKTHHPRQIETIQVDINTAIEQKIQAQLSELTAHMEMVIDELTQFARDNNKHPRHKFQLFTPEGEVDGWKAQLQQEQQQKTGLFGIFTRSRGR